MGRSASSSPTMSCSSEGKVKISPLCCNFLYPKQFLGLIGWIEITIGLFLLYTVSDVDKLKHISIPGFDRSSFYTPSDETHLEEYRDQVFRESMELQFRRIFLYALSWFFILGGFMNFMSFNWPRHGGCIKNIALTRIVPMLLLSPTVFNMLICLYSLAVFIIRTSQKFMDGNCRSLAALACTDSDFTMGYIAFVGVFSVLLVAVYLYLFRVMYSAVHYIWARTYRSPPIHRAVKVSTSWSHAATKSRSYNHSLVNDAASSGVNEYACPPSSFATVKQFYDLHEINEMNGPNEYAAVPMKIFKPITDTEADGTLSSIYGGISFKSRYPQRTISSAPHWDRYRLTLGLPPFEENEGVGSSII